MENTSEHSSSQFQGIPQELLCQIGKASSRITIGIPKERLAGERRVALTPEAVEILTGYGHRIIVESGAGLGINYSDNHYSEAGAEITDSPAIVFQSDMIIKILPPLPEEVNLIRPRITVCSFVSQQLLRPDAFRLMIAKRITAIDYRYLLDELLNYAPIMGALAEIEGYAAINIASDLLSNTHGGKGILLGGVAGISPTEIVIVGAGNAGTTAAKAAMAMGASIKIFDNNICRLHKIQQSLGFHAFTSNFHPNVLRNAFQSADVVIGALPTDNPEHRYIIAEELVSTMKKGALIIDLRINQGGCFETTCGWNKSTPEIFEQYGVLHYCKPFISNTVARTTSMAFSNLFIPILTAIGDLGGVQNYIKSDAGFKNGIYLFQGRAVKDSISASYGIRSNNIDIYLAAF